MTTDHRTAVINGLLDLAALLEANPDLPPPFAVHASYYPDRNTDAALTAEIDKVAAILGKPISPEHVEHGHYTVGEHFGPVEYKAIAILATARARYDAEHSYADNITLA